MAELTKQWYVMRAISGKETKVKEMLEAACKNNKVLGSRLHQVLVPTEKVYTTRAGKKVLKEKNLFSGYVFVEAELTAEVEDILRNTTNVIDFVRSRDANRHAEPIRESEILRMLGAAGVDEEVGEDINNDFIIGEKVKVNYGPFNGFVGEIEEINREKRKLKVVVKVFGRETPIELDNSQVERQ
ncbi:MAG: transcription termination/antitermination factor NusG [Muribaculaceae bacterium]|nr:transcription termination/antitermination factor NusG [Muribaculaceae bacterium]